MCLVAANLGVLLLDLQMCANCSINTSTVWRTGNAGLTLCNACGMFYNKHDHEHRPEHLIASARAKAEAQQVNDTDTTRPRAVAVSHNAA